MHSNEAVLTLARAFACQQFLRSSAGELVPLTVFRQAMDGVNSGDEARARAAAFEEDGYTLAPIYTELTWGAAPGLIEDTAMFGYRDTLMRAQDIAYSTPDAIKPFMDRRTWHRLRITGELDPAQTETLTQRSMELQTLVTERVVLDHLLFYTASTHTEAVARWHDMIESLANNEELTEDQALEASGLTVWPLVNDVPLPDLDSHIHQVSNELYRCSLLLISPVVAESTAIMIGDPLAEPLASPSCQAVSLN